VAACPRCYSLLPAGATFCPSCGATVGPVAAGALPQARSPPTYGSAPTEVGGSSPKYPSVPSQPSTIPLFPGESGAARFENSPEGQAKVVRFNGLITIGLMAAIWGPFIVLFAFSGAFNPGILLLPARLLLFTGMIWRNVSKVKSYPPARVFVTDRRVIVQESGREATTASIGLENVGNVEVNQSTRAARSAGVAWVYFLPLGTTKAMVGGGRARHATPGVVWVPAVPVARAQEMRSVVLLRSRDLQTRLGYPTPQ
jgi:hypothetical protein